MKPLSSLAGGDSKRNIEAIALLALLLTISTFSLINLTSKTVACFPGDIGTIKCPLVGGAHDTTSLGVWKNFPPATSCDVATLPINVSAQVCELMGNSTYRGVFGLANMVGYRAYLSVGCVLPSGTAGAVLQLQYALYSSATELNTTNWQSVGTSLSIVTGVVPCPGNLIGSDGPLNSTTTNISYIFRVIGADGNGPGDNPRFSYVSVIIKHNDERVFVAVGPTNIQQSNTQFTANMVASIPVAPSGSQTVNFRWFATNASSSIPSCGSNILTGASDVCWQKGTATCIIAAAGISCSVTTLYTTAFTGSTSTVVAVTTAGQVVTLDYGTVDLLHTQTVTV